MFPRGMFVLIQLGSNGEQLLQVCPGIVLGDGRVGDTKLVKLPGGEEQDVLVNLMIPVDLLAPEDLRKDPQVLFDKDRELNEDSHRVFGDALRKLVPA